ncbi:MAG: tRNA (N(6)-L-threonylcarbamoyladenosine(37)-C(2))-methylthiotransferase MtaB [Candidatus Zixiibacteriota bacterium]
MRGRGRSDPPRRIGSACPERPVLSAVEGSRRGEGVRRASFYTLGCRLNQAETALIAEQFRTSGYAIVEHGAAADVAVIHTCSVTEHADARCRQEIRKARRRSPDALVCVVGCYAQAEPGTVAAIDGVDLIVGNDRKFALADLIGVAIAARSGVPVSPWADVGTAGRALTRQPTVLVSPRPDATEIEYPMAGYYPHQTRANIKVQDGCDFCCAFCILPRIRGQARSRPLPDIIAEGHELARRGHKELVITGVNVGTYASNGHTLADVARSLSGIRGVARVRVSSIEPSTVSDDLLRWMAESPAACRHLHLPLQSGDDRVLSRMKRVYTTSEYARFIDKVKTMIPDVGLGTDIMVGFPGESERGFANTVRFVSELPFSYLHVFSYSDRPKTAGLYLSDKCSPDAIKERSAIMHDLAAWKKQRFFADHIGRTVEVLFETVDTDGWRKGFTGSYLRVGVPPDHARENDLSDTIVAGIDSDFCRGAGAPRVEDPERSREAVPSTSEI